MTIKEMLERSGWTQKRFAEYFGIPYRTVQNWVAGTRECPDYVRILLQYKLEHERIISQESEEISMKSVKFYRVVENGKYKQSTIVSAQSEEEAIDKAASEEGYYKKDCTASLYAEYTAQDIINAFIGKSEMENYVSDTGKHRIVWDYQKRTASNATQPATGADADCIGAEIGDYIYILDL